MKNDNKNNSGMQKPNKNAGSGEVGGKSVGKSGGGIGGGSGGVNGGKSGGVEPRAKERWYAEGLRFTCTQCGNCCTGPPGYVWFTPEEGRAMAAGLGLSEKRFYQLHAHKIYGRWSLNERLREDSVGPGRSGGNGGGEGEYDCVFLTEREDGKRGCSIYETRPTQCRTWPFWPENLSSERAYRRASETCPGMTAGMQGESSAGDFYPLEQIRIIRDRNVK